MNISLTGLRRAVRETFRKYGLTVDEQRLTEMIHFLGFINLDLQPAHKVGGDPSAQLVPLDDKKAVDERLTRLAGANPAIEAAEEEGFSYAKATT